MAGGPPLDGQRLRADLTAIARAGFSDETRSGEVLIRLKAALAAIRGQARAALEAGAEGITVARMLAEGQDELIRALYDYATKHVYYAQNPSAAERLAIVATGGYGRGALAFGSDIDLLFLMPAKQTAWGESVTEFVLYRLWDLGLKVGHATRSVSECVRLAKADMTIRTSVLEARFLWGDRALHDDLKRRFWAEVAVPPGLDFVEAKLAERERRLMPSGNSRYRVEPDVKDGKGGLRDLNTLFWIAKYVLRVETPEELVRTGFLTADELALFARAESFLWRVRCHLHALAGRAENVLSFDRQPEMARRMGYASAPDEGPTAPVERFMKDYFLTAKSVGDLTRIFSARLEETHRKRPPALSQILGFGRKRLGNGLTLENGRIGIASAPEFLREAVNLIRLFAAADAEGADIHPDALTLVSRNLARVDDALRGDGEANRLFMSLLASRRDPERILRLMNEAGLFGAFVPEFGRVVAMMQFNMYHHFTVDEHLIRAVGNVARIERGEVKDDHPLASQVIHRIEQRNALYLAMLLHDIAKGMEADHSEEGEAIARRLGPRFGLTDAETGTVAWLVRHHLAMSDTAQRRDLSDPKTIRDFAGLVQSPERLRMLLVLTVADIRAVGPGVFNHWKGQLLRTLYRETEALLSGGHAAEGRRARVQAAKTALADAIADWPAPAREAALARHYDGYWLGLDTATHLAHARFLRDRKPGPLAVATRPDPRRAATEVTVHTADHPGLIARLAGAFALAGASIVDARAFTTVDGMALDMFFVQDADQKPFDEPRRLKRLEETMLDVLTGRLSPHEKLAAKAPRPRAAAIPVPPQVTFDNEASDVATVIEVAGADRPGLLHDLALALFTERLSIHAAIITTYGEKAVDVFYVKDAFGLKIDAPRRMDAVEAALMRALAG